MGLQRPRLLLSRRILNRWITANAVCVRYIVPSPRHSAHGRSPRRMKKKKRIPRKVLPRMCTRQFKPRRAILCLPFCMVCATCGVLLFHVSRPNCAIYWADLASVDRYWTLSTALSD